MKRYKKYMFIILSVLLAGGCVQEDINEPAPGSRTECTDGKTPGMDIRYQ